MARFGSICLLALVLVACGTDHESDPVKITASVTPSTTATIQITLSPTATATRTPTESPTLTASPTSTITPTLATRVLEVTAVMPGVPGFLPESNTPDALPVDEWVRLESDHPNLDYVSGEWIEMWSWSAGQNEYRYTIDPGAAVHLNFEGEGVRICYVSFWNGGIWEVVVDGQVVGTLDSYAAEAHFTCTDTFPVPPGPHTLLVRNTGQHHPDSSGTMLALDAVLTYQSRASAASYISETQAALPTPRPASRIELIAGPPTIQPTETDEPPAAITITVLIAYDENANRAVDPAEGVQGIPVRLLDVNTNRVLAQTFTDTSGYAQLQVTTNAQMRLVVPYFGQYWDVASGYRRDSTFTLLLPAGNQPGLIP